MAQKQQTIEERAPSVEEAVEAGLAKLGLKEEAVEIEVVDEGRRGLFGMGGRDAVVRLHPRSRPEPATEALQPPRREVPKPVPPPKPAKEPERETVSEVKKTQEAPRPAQSENEKDDADVTAVAVEVVESLLQQMDVDASLDVSQSDTDDVTGRRVTILNITGSDLGLLIGARGETLDALQHLSRLMAGHRLKQRVNFVIDVEGYRARREQALARLAERMGKKAIDRGRPVTLEPMPAYERRIIHMTLREDPRVRTESTGEGDQRKVRIYPL
jgi:spoIIIJ-associated protein